MPSKRSLPFPLRFKRFECYFVCWFSSCLSCSILKQFLSPHMTVQPINNITTLILIDQKSMQSSLTSWLVASSSARTRWITQAATNQTLFFCQPNYFHKQHQHQQWQWKCCDGYWRYWLTKQVRLFTTICRDRRCLHMLTCSLLWFWIGVAVIVKLLWWPNVWKWRRFAFFVCFVWLIEVESLAGLRILHGFNNCLLVCEHQERELHDSDGEFLCFVWAVVVIG